MDNKKAIIVFLLFIAFVYWVGSSVTSTNNNPQNTTPTGNINYDEAFLNSIVQSISKQLPRQMNKYMQATTVSAAGKKLIFKYNLINATEVTVNKKQLHEEYYTNSVNAACTTPDISKVLLNGISVEYQIYDKQNKFVTQYTITSADCKK